MRYQSFLTARFVRDGVTSNPIRDKSFTTYVRVTVRGRGARLRLLSAACFSAALILNQGVLGLEVVAGGLLGSLLFAYPLWRRWGREPVREF